MYLDNGRIQTDALNTYPQQLLVLQLGKHPVEHACLAPAHHARVNRMPPAVALWQRAPFTTIACYEAAAGSAVRLGVGVDLGKNPERHGDVDLIGAPVKAARKLSTL